MKQTIGYNIKCPTAGPETISAGPETITASLEVQEETKPMNDNAKPSAGSSTNKPGTVTRKKAGVVTKLPTRYTENIAADTKVKAFETVVPKKLKADVTDQLMPSCKFTSEWFEFDDETVRMFDESEFTELLSGQAGALLGTPYLLFYHKATLC